jgi:hypothetical protein
MSSESIQRKYEFNWIIELSVLGLSIALFLSWFTVVILWLLLPLIIGIILGFVIFGVRSYKKEPMALEKGKKGNQCQNVRGKLQKENRAMRIWGGVVNLLSFVFLLSLFLLIVFS